MSDQGGQGKGKSGHGGRGRANQGRRKGNINKKNWCYLMMQLQSWGKTSML